MRTYLPNSPEAATRVVALAVLADGHVSGREMALLMQRGVLESLGLSESRLQQVLQHLTEDLISSGLPTWVGAGVLDDALVDGVADDVTDPALRRTVQALCAAAVGADGHQSEGEQALLSMLNARWGLPAAAFC